MIDKKEAEISKYKLGLVLKTILENNKVIAVKNKSNGIKDINLITSFGKLESSTGLRKATIVDIVTAKRSAEFSSVSVIVAALGISFKEFGQLYDLITESQVTAFKQELIKSSKYRGMKK